MGFPMIRQVSILVLSCTIVAGCTATIDVRATDSQNTQTLAPAMSRTQAPVATLASSSPTSKPHPLDKLSTEPDFEDNLPNLPDGAITRLGDGYLTDVAISSNRQYLAVAARVGFYIYRLPSLELHRFIPTPFSATFVTFSPDNTRIEGGGLGFELPWKSTWDVATGKRISEVFIPASNSWIVYDVMYNANGDIYAERGSSFGMQAVVVMITNLETGHTFSTSGDVWQMAFSPNGTSLALAFKDGTVEIQDPLEEKQSSDRSVLRQLQVPNTEPITEISWSPDSQNMIVVAAHTAWLFNVQRQELLHEFYLPKEVASAAWSFDGHNIFITTGNQVSAWDSRTYEQSWQANVQGSIYYVDQERVILLSADWQFTVLSAETGEALYQKQDQRPGYATDIAYSPDGKWIAAASPILGVTLYDAATYAYTRALHVDSRTLKTISWSHDSTRIAAGYEDGAVIMWDVVTGNQIDEWLADTGITGIAWSPDGLLLAVHTSGKDIDSGALTIYEPITHTQIDRFSVASGCCYQSALYWSPNSEALAIHGEQTVVWDRNSKQSTATSGPVLWLADGEPGWVNFDSSQVISLAGNVVVETETQLLRDQLAVSPDYSRLASASYWGDTVIVYDMKTGMQLLTLYRHIAEVLDIAWSPDSTKLISSSNDGTVLVWKAR